MKIKDVGLSKFPDWLNKRFIFSSEIHRIKAGLRKFNLHTVCEEARCPNISTCMGNNSLTFIILGKHCTRNCSFCNIKKSSSEVVDSEEPKNISAFVNEYKISHAIITSVTRDDLEDGGAFQFASTVSEIRKENKDVAVEVLTPDFCGNSASIDKIIEQKPDIFAHNIETVNSLYPRIRPKADYTRSLSILSYIKEQNKNIKTKSGIMVGFGESVKEVEATIRDIKNTGCDYLTIGQYLMPSKGHYPVKEYVEPSVFIHYKEFAEKEGIPFVKSGSYVRSSYRYD